MKKSREAFENSEVAVVFEAYPKNTRAKLMCLRQLIFDIASETEGVGALEETLKWGQPSYLTTKSKSGSTVRIGRVKSQEGQYATYFHCQTTLVETFKEIYRDKFKYERNRSIVFSEEDNVPVKELGHCISLALTYHLNKRSGNRV